MGKITAKKIDKENINTGGRTKADYIKEIAELKNENLIDINPNDIKTADPFKSIFPIKPEVLGPITDNMKDSGFDQSQPVIIWKEKEILIDGHTRKQASINAELETIKAYYKSFENESDALNYAYSLQFDRRNIIDSDLFSFIESLDLKSLSGKGKTKEKLARFCGISATKAMNILSVLKNGNPKDIVKIKDSQLSINQVYETIRTKADKPEDKKGSGLTPKKSLSKESIGDEKQKTFQGSTIIDLAIEKIEKYKSLFDCGDSDLNTVDVKSQGIYEFLISLKSSGIITSEELETFKQSVRKEI